MLDATNDLVTIIKDFGFPIVAAMGLGYFVYYIWKWVTEEIKPVLGDASSTLIKLVDRIRMLDNDMIRLNTQTRYDTRIQRRHNQRRSFR